MKKITFFVLLVSLLLPMSLDAQSSLKKVSKNEAGAVKGDRMKAENKMATRANRLAPQCRPVHSNAQGIRRAPSAEAIIWDFEDESQLDDWILIDSDGDGHNWTYFDNTGLTLNRMNAHEGEGLVVSASYDEVSETALFPDNWLISPEVTLGGVLTLWASAQDESWSDEVFGIYVSVGDPNNIDGFEQVGADVTATGAYVEYQFDLSQYAGQTGHFAIRHYKVSDMFYLKIDDVTIDPDMVMLPDPTVPTNVAVAPGVTSADVTWEDTDDTEWNLRYKIYNPNEAQTFTWDLEDDSQFDDWSIVDLDGDGYNWALTPYDDAHSGSYIFYSASYLNYTSLDPDNLLFTPEVQLGGTVSFWAESFNGGYLENFGVFVLLSEDMGKENVEQYLKKIGDDAIAPEEWTQYTYDLSDYAGKTGRVVIRHYDSYDNYYLFVDDISIDVPGDEPAEWIYVNGLDDTAYTIEDLTPGTDYIVQVQAINEKGESDWTEPTLFTTLSVLVLLNDDSNEDTKNSDNLTNAINEGGKVVATLSGRTFYKDTKWNTLCLPFDVSEEQIAKSPLADATIKKLYGGDVTGKTVNIVFTDATAIDAGSFYIFKWSEVGDDIVDPTFSNVEIVKNDAYINLSLDNGHFVAFGNFDSFGIDPSKDGCYTYYLTSDGDMKYSDKYRVLKTFRIFFRFTADNDAGALEFNLDFGDGNTQTGIVELDGNGHDNRAPEGYYNLQGVKYNGKPIQKGVYINNGHKVVVK